MPRHQIALKSQYSFSTGTLLIYPFNGYQTKGRHRAPYGAADFDFAIAYIDALAVFYIFPAEVFISYGSEIHLVEADKRQRKPRSASYRQRWDLIQPELQLPSSPLSLSEIP